MYTMDLVVLVVHDTTYGTFMYCIYGTNGTVQYDGWYDEFN